MSSKTFAEINAGIKKELTTYYCALFDPKILYFVDGKPQKRK